MNYGIFSAILGDYLRLSSLWDDEGALQNEIVKFN